MLEETREGAGTIDLMRQSGALLSGHFELASGLHSEQYVQCALLLEDPVRAEHVGRRLAAALRGVIPDFTPEAVISPAIGGIVIGHEVARALGVRSLFAERAAAKMELRRGFSLRQGERVMVVEDVFTTGGSIREVMAVVNDNGGVVGGVGSIVNRGVSVDFGVPAAYLVRAEIANYEPGVCPLCKKGLEVVKPGTKRQQMGSERG
jgi:orotate phosphoribosyltransferase